MGKGGVELGPVLGVSIVGSATASPHETASLSNAAAWEALWGPQWRAQLETRGWNVEHPWEAWGVLERAWWYGPAGGTPEGQGRAVEAATSHGTETLAIVAARKTLEDARLESMELDVLIATTSTPNRISAALASVVAKALGSEALALDVRAGGAGGLRALFLGAQQIAAGARRVLIVAAETSSAYLDPHDPSSLLYGDGAAALLLAPGPATSGLLMSAGGQFNAPGSPFTVTGGLPPSGPRPRFQTPDKTYREALRAAWQHTAQGLLAWRGKRGRFDALLPYPVSKNQLGFLEGRLDMPAEHARDVLKHRGCLGTAGTLAAWARARELGELAPGTRVASGAVGGGIAWAAVDWRV